MVDAVNRLVGNRLAGAGEVTLPGVGRLCVERRAAQRLSRNRVVPPCRTVAFSSGERGVSLVDEIASAARVDAAKAQEIYDTWLARVSGEHRLTIEGVGELRYKSFVLDPAFDAQLNPQGHAPVQLRAPRRRFDFVLWLGVAAILFVVGFVGYWWKTSGADSMRDRPVAVASASVPGAANDPAADSLVGVAAALPESGTLPPEGGTATTDPAVDASVPTTAPSPTTSSAPAADAAASIPTPAATAETAADGVHSFVAGRRYVVLGVFTTEANARRAVAQAQQSEPSLRPAVYRFGAKFLVSPFDAAEAESCTQFIRAHADRFPGMWTYAAR